MPSWVSQNSELARKQNLIEKRLRRLQAAVKAGDGLMLISLEAREGPSRGVGTHQGETRPDQRASAA
jgi:hypothetical protein